MKPMELTAEDIQKIRTALMDEIRAEIKKEIDKPQLISKQTLISHS